LNASRGKSSVCLTIAFWLSSNSFFWRRPANENADTFGVPSFAGFSTGGLITSGSSTSSSVAGSGVIGAAETSALTLIVSVIVFSV